MNYQNRTYDIIAVRRVIRNLQSNDPAEIKQGIDSSASFGGNEDICNALIPLLRHTDGDMRARTIMALGHVLHPNCIRHLELALADPLPKVRSTSIDALARLKALHSAPKIAAMLGDRSPEVRYSACEAIGTLKYTHAAHSPGADGASCEQRRMTSVWTDRGAHPRS
jgi:HEAT repeat protein